MSSALDQAPKNGTHLNIDVLCMDKTGTLTANRLILNSVQPLGHQPAEEVKPALGSFVGSASTTTTGTAIAAGVGIAAHAAVDEVAFASARKCNALAFAEDVQDGAMHGTYMLGAVEMPTPYLADDGCTPDSPLSTAAAALSDPGLRLLLFAHNPTVTTLHNATGEPELPPLTLLALVSLSDELRPQATETLRRLAALGVQLKIISGDMTGNLELPVM